MKEKQQHQKPTLEEFDPRGLLPDTASWLTKYGYSYKVLHAEGVANNTHIYYCHDNAKYYTKGRKELPLETFKKALPYLTWKYDQLVEEEIEVEVEQEYTTKNGNKSKRKVKELQKTGNVINKFPPTTENILAKRKELREELAANGEIPTEAEIRELYYSASPTLKSHEMFAEEEGRLSESRALRLKRMMQQGLM